MNTIDERLIQALRLSGGKLAQGKLREKLGLSDSEYSQIVDEAIRNGYVKVGRGRGGVLCLVSDTEREEILSKVKNKPETAPRSKKSSNQSTIVSGKENYQPLPNEVSAFKTGMHVVRPPSFMSEDKAWENLRHYVVVSTDESSVYIRDRFNSVADVKQNSPEGFYVVR